MSRPLIYAARWVLPIDSPPIENGEVIIEDSIIQAIRQRSSPEDECRDFGNAILMPGLVNAHTHLEYTALRGFLEDVPFFPWIRALNAAKSQFAREDWLWSARLGALETVAGGVTTIGDNTHVGVTMQAATESGLRGRIYQEVFGIEDRQPVAPIMAALQSDIDGLRELANDRLDVGVSPHALYTVRPELFAAINKYGACENLSTSIHIAESCAESDLTERGEGPFAEMFARRGISWRVPHATPTVYADSCGALNPATLAVHCVHQTSDDIVRLAQSGAAIVHCPKSNAKLGAGIAPLAQWLRTPGLRLALGTDSAVSNNTLDLWEEMRFALFMQRAHSEDVAAVAAPGMVRMATLGGAEALGLAARIGSLTPGKQADIIAVRLNSAHATPSHDPYAALVYSVRADDVCFVLCGGEPLYDSGEWLTLNSRAILDAACDVRAKVSQVSVAT